MESQIDLDDIIKHQNYIYAVKMAMLHRRVSMVSYNRNNHTNKQKNKQSTVPCRCCGQSPRQLLNQNFNITQLGFLGTGYALYFSFQMLCIVLLLMFYLIIAFIKKINKFWRRNGFHNYIEQNELLCIIVTFLSLLTIYLFSIYMTSLHITTDQNTTSPEDYSILIKNIPQNYNKQRNFQFQMQQFIEQQYSQVAQNQEPISIVQTCMCYNLAPLKTFQKNKLNQIAELKQYNQNKSKKRSILIKILGFQDLPFDKIPYHGVDYGLHSNRKQIQRLKMEQKVKKKLAQLDKIISNGYKDNQLMFVGEMIVSFNTQDMCQKVLETNKKCPMYFYGNKLELQRAQHPKGIYWYNLHLDQEDYKLRKIFSFISCSSIFLSSLFIQIGLTYLKSLTKGTHYEYVIFKFLTTIIINIINIIIPSWILRFFSDFQGHRTRSQQMLSFAKKCVILQLMNTLVVPLIILFWFQIQQPFFEKQNGVLFRNVLISVILLMTSPRCILKEIAIYLFKRKYNIKGIVPNYLTVRQLCQLYQYPAFQIQGRYSDMLKTILLTFIFGSQIKKIILYAFVGFFFSYWIDKFNLARKRIVKYNVNNVLNTQLMAVLHLIIPLFIGTQICLKGKSIIKIFLFLISLYFYFKPFIKSVSWRQKQEKGKNITYKECNQKKIFETDYRKQNPALRNDEVSKIVLHMILNNR